MWLWMAGACVADVTGRRTMEIRLGEAPDSTFVVPGSGRGTTWRPGVEPPPQQLEPVSTDVVGAPSDGRIRRRVFRIVGTDGCIVVDESRVPLPPVPRRRWWRPDVEDVSASLGAACVATLLWGVVPAVAAMPAAYPHTNEARPEAWFPAPKAGGPSSSERPVGATARGAGRMHRPTVRFAAPQSASARPKVEKDHGATGPDGRLRSEGEHRARGLDTVAAGEVDVAIDRVPVGISEFASWDEGVPHRVAAAIGSHGDGHAEVVTAAASRVSPRRRRGRGRRGRAGTDGQATGIVDVPGKRLGFSSSFGGAKPMPVVRLDDDAIEMVYVASNEASMTSARRIGTVAAGVAATRGDVKPSRARVSVRRCLAWPGPRPKRAQIAVVLAGGLGDPELAATVAAEVPGAFETLRARLPDEASLALVVPDRATGRMSYPSAFEDDPARARRVLVDALVRDATDAAPRARAAALRGVAELAWDRDRTTRRLVVWVGPLPSASTEDDASDLLAAMDDLRDRGVRIAAFVPDGKGSVDAPTVAIPASEGWTVPLAALRGPSKILRGWLEDLARPEPHCATWRVPR